jgi:hypothetical protein
MSEDTLTRSEAEEIANGINNDIEAKDVKSLGLNALQLLSRLIDLSKKIEVLKDKFANYDLKHKQKGNF